MGPIKLPEGIKQPRCKQRWGWLLLWTLFVFSGGIAAGPKVFESGLVERACSVLGIRAPRFVKASEPEVSSIRPLPAQDIATVPASSGVHAPVVEERGEAPKIAVEPVAVRPDKEDKPEKTAVVVAPQAPASVSHTAAPARVELAVVEPRSAQAKRTKGGSDKTATTAGAPAAPPALVEPAVPAKKTSVYHDPFASDDETVPAPKSAGSKSHESLDKNKDIDAMLKDVQKSNPPPPAKREAQPSLPPLSPADIAKVMAGVKTRGNDCAQRLGAKGVAELKLAVGKDGKVTDARVGGKLANTPLGACIEKAARASSFPPSSGLRFDYRIDVR
jgi:hypothetical protein